MRFHDINPKLKIRIANPLILLRSLGNWVQRQLMRGMLAIQKQRIGIIIQHTAKVTKLN